MVDHSTFTSLTWSLTALELIETTAQIINSTFVSNRKGSYRECVTFISEYVGCLPGYIGGAIIATNSVVDISKSKFEDNIARLSGVIFAEQHSIINMSGNVFVNNNAIFGGALHSHNSNITIKAYEFYYNNANGEAASFIAINNIRSAGGYCPVISALSQWRKLNFIITMPPILEEYWVPSAALSQ